MSTSVSRWSLTACLSDENMSPALTLTLVSGVCGPLVLGVGGLWTVADAESLGRRIVIRPREHGEPSLLRWPLIPTARTPSPPIRLELPPMEPTQALS